MKTFISILLLSAPLSLFAKDIFFECELDDPEKFGSYANITYNSETNAAGIDSDFMNKVTPANGEIFKVVNLTKTGDELILEFYAYYNAQNLSRFRINRSSLKLSGTRNGLCKIVEKDLAF